MLCWIENIWRGYTEWQAKWNMIREKLQTLSRGLTMITGLFPAALTIAFKSCIPSTRPKPISKGGRGDNKKDKLRRRFSNLERQTLKENNNQIHRGTHLYTTSPISATWALHCGPNIDQAILTRAYWQLLAIKQFHCCTDIWKMEHPQTKSLGERGHKILSAG